MKKAGIGAKTYLVFLLVLMYLPIGVVVLFSFNASTARTPTVFTGFSLQWYEALFDGEALKNSLVIAGCSVGLSTVLGTLGALGQVRRTARRRLAAAAQGVMESLTILPIMLPEIILGVAFMLLFSALGLRSGMLTLVLAHTTFCVPYVYLLVKSRLATMGDDLENAARDLGASPAQALRTVTLPLTRPAILSGALLALAMSLDDFVISFFVSGAGATTLPLKIYSSVRYGVSSQINALCVVMLAAVFLLVGVSQLLLRKKN
mgnify:CR=1 FL=1